MQAGQSGTGQIYIFIDKNGSDGGDQQLKATGEEEKKNKAQKDKEKAREAIFTALIQAGKQAINQGINYYGQLTGDTTATRNIQSAVSIGADLLTIAKGGWVGAIAVGTKYALQIGNSLVQTELTNRQLNYNKSLLGDISTKGSRYW